MVKQRMKRGRRIDIFDETFHLSFRGEQCQGENVHFSVSRTEF